jgi:hypothetical protein
VGEEGKAENVCAALLCLPFLGRTSDPVLRVPWGLATRAALPGKYTESTQESGIWRGQGAVCVQSRPPDVFILKGTLPTRTGSTSGMALAGTARPSLARSPSAGTGPQPAQRGAV